MKKIVIGLAAVGLLLAGCSGESKTSAPPATPTSAAQTTTETTTPKTTPVRVSDSPLTGLKRDAEIVSTVKDLTGMDIPESDARTIATSLCGMLGEGMSIREVADDFSEIMGPAWGDQQSRVVAMSAQLEYCPEHLDG